MMNGQKNVSTARRKHAGRLPALALALGTVSPIAVAMTAGAFFVVPTISMAQDFSFANVKVEGNKRIETATILSYAKLPRGQSVSGDQLNEAYQRIQGSGLFQSVDLIPNGSTLTIQVLEFPTINVVAFEGNRIIKDEALSKNAQTQPNRVLNPATLDADANAMAVAYADAGRPNVRITPQVIRRSDDRVDVVFEFDEGYTSEVKRISFTGNRNYSERTLRQVLQTKQAGILHWLISSDNFVPSKLEADRQALIDFYQSRGYPDVRVTGVSSDISRARDAFFITYNINEGQQYEFGNISTISEVPELNQADFAPLAKIKSGSTYTPTAIEMAVTRMEQLALNKGANFVRVDPRITRDPASQKLNVQFVLEVGPRVFVERIDIEGNTTTMDTVIRREFQTVEGDPFNPRAIKNAADRIKALGYFSNAEVTTSQGSAPDQVVIDVNVEEQPTGSLSFGATYGAASGFGIVVGLQENNFLGRGQQLGINIGTTSDNQQSSIDFADPYFLGRDMRARIRAWYNTSDNDNSDYSTRVQGIQPSIDFPIAENSRLELRYSYGRNKLYDVTPYTPETTVTNDDGTTTVKPASGSSPVLSYEESLGERTNSAVGYTYSWDTMRTSIDPRYGFTFRFGQDFSGLGGEVKAIKTTALLAAQRKIMHETVTLRAELEGGAITARGDSDLTVLDRFSGYGKIRGFEPNGYGPRDLGAPNRDALGGNYFVSLRLDSEFPIGLPEEYGITGGLFWDTGTLWGTNDSGMALDMGGSDDVKWRSAVGFSIYWRSAIGPLRLNFSRPLAKQEYDKVQNFDLTISTTF